MTWMALIRDVSPDMGACELSFVGRAPIDIALARRQHDAYRQALELLGCTVLRLPAEPDLPDAVFVEDTALVLEEVAVMTRPGAESRRAEVGSIAAVLADYRPMLAIESPGTLDGGDILRIGRKIFVGLSARSNRQAIGQLERLLAPHGYTVQGVPISGCLHLKSAVTQVAPDTVLVQPAWVDAANFPGLRVIEVDLEEEHAANAVLAGRGLIYPDCFPRTLARLRDAGIEVTTVDVSELQRAEGAVTCCSLLFETT